MSTVEGNYTLEILMLSYENPSHMAKSLENFRLGCCEGDTTTPCRPCDNAFRVCVRNIPTILEGDCDLTKQDSTLIAEDDDDLMFTIGEDIGGLSNPITVSGEMWVCGLIVREGGRFPLLHVPTLKVCLVRFVWFGKLNKSTCSSFLLLSVSWYREKLR